MIAGEAELRPVVGRNKGAAPDQTLQAVAHVAAVVTMLAPAAIGAVIKNGPKVIHPLAARAKEIHNAVQRQMGGWIRRATTVAATSGEGQDAVAITVKVMKDAEAADRMVNIVKSQLKPGEVFGGSSATTHAEEIGIKFQQAQGATAGQSGASNLNCPACQNWVQENAPGFELVNLKPQ